MGISCFIWTQVSPCDYETMLEAEFSRSKYVSYPVWSTSV